MLGFGSCSGPGRCSRRRGSGSDPGFPHLTPSSRTWHRGSRSGPGRGALSPGAARRAACFSPGVAGTSSSAPRMPVRLPARSHGRRADDCHLHDHHGRRAGHPDALASAEGPARAVRAADARLGRAGRARGRRRGRGRRGGPRDVRGDRGRAARLPGRRAVARQRHGRCRARRARGRARRRASSSSCSRATRP